MQKQNLLFTEAAAACGVQYEHPENPYVDFKREPLLPHAFSQNGPGLAVGDVNGDGLKDFCVGGPHKAPGKLFLQNSAGKFVAKGPLDGSAGGGRMDAYSVF